MMKKTQRGKRLKKGVPRQFKVLKRRESERGQRNFKDVGEYFIPQNFKIF